MKIPLLVASVLVVLVTGRSRERFAASNNTKAATTGTKKNVTAKANATTASAKKNASNLTHGSPGGGLKRGNRTKSNISAGKTSLRPKFAPGKNPHKFNDDTLGEEAFDAAEPQFADLDCLKKDNVVTIDEAATFGVKNGVSWSELKPIFQVLDANKDGRITKQEYNSNTTYHQKVLEDLSPGFADIDLDGNNLISSKEWMAFCQGWMTPHPSEKTCMNLFVAADTSAPKKEIDRSEFVHAGKECHSIDDGDCEKTAKKSFLQLGNRRFKALSQIVRQRTMYSGKAMLALLLRRHRRAKIA